jgi:preprotein translocase subunit SecY
MFWKNLLRNILLLGAIFIVLLIVSPTIMSQVYDMLGQLFGPLLIVMVIVAALPRRSRSSSRK